MRGLTRAGRTLATVLVAAGIGLAGLLPIGPAQASAAQAATAQAAAAPAAAARVPVAAPLVRDAAPPERDLVGPDGRGHLPAYRTDGPTVFVCGTSKDDIDTRVASFPTDLRVATLSLWTQCQTNGFRSVQEAVSSVKVPGTTIKILPGLYLEPDAAVPPATTPAGSAPSPCVGLPPALSYAQQVECPHEQNLVAVIGKVDLQIEGVGRKPDDVIIDAAYRKPYALRVDRSPGTYLRNFTAQHATGSAVYVLESDGFAIDNVVARFNDEYGLSAVAADHGLANECDAYGNGNAGISVAAAPDLNVANKHTVDRYAVEVSHCDSHDNLIGFSGSAGDSIRVHDNVFSTNSVGLATDSLARLPGAPQNHALFENNEIGANNQDYYRYVRDGTCAKPSGQRGYDTGVVCPRRGVPPGTGVLNLGGNYDVWRGNWVYGNSYAGFVLAFMPGHFRGEAKVLSQVDTSHHNRVYGNQLGVRPGGAADANGMDYWWDGQGIGSCWQAPSGASATPRVLPKCGADDLPAGLGTARYLPEPAQALTLYVCTRFDPATQQLPASCSWYGATGLDRIEVRVALGGAILLGLALLALVLRVLRSSRAGLAGATLVLAGLVAGVYGTVRPTSPLTGIGLALLGAGWLGVGAALHGRSRPALGWVTLFMGVFALLGAVDQLLVPIPLLPVPPSLLRLLLELVWLPSTVVAAINGPEPEALADELPRRRGPRRPRRVPRRSRDPLEQFAAALRD